LGLEFWVNLGLPGDFRGETRPDRYQKEQKNIVGGSEVVKFDGLIDRRNGCEGCSLLGLAGLGRRRQAMRRQQWWWADALLGPVVAGLILEKRPPSGEICGGGDFPKPFN